MAVVAMVFAVGCASKQTKMARAEQKEQKAQLKAQQEQAKAEQKAQQAEAKRLAAEDKQRREEDARMAAKVRKEHEKYEKEQREAFGSDVIRDERMPRQVDYFDRALAAAGANEDLMLNDAHFSNGELNSLGRSKVALIARAAPAGKPVVIYVTGDEKANQPRVASVQNYWKAMPYSDLELQVKPGINDAQMTDTSVGIKGLAKQEKTNYTGTTGSSSSMSGAGGSSSSGSNSSRVP
jgi:hypothetical protein